MVPVRGYHTAARRHRAQDGHVQRLCRVRRKDYTLGLLAAKELGKRAARRTNRAGGVKLTGMGSTAAAAELVQCVHDCLAHTGGTITCCSCAVEIDHGWDP